MKIYFFATIFGLASICACSQKKQSKAFTLLPQLIKKVDSLNTESNQNDFKGTIIVVKNNEIVLDKQFGNIDSNVKTAYWIGSMTKHYTATAILKLQENKKLSVKDSIGKFLKNVPIDKRGITIHHLLTHTSGLANDYVVDGVTNKKKAAEIILNSPLHYEIGQKFNYSAEGFNLLAILIETISGESYEEFMTNNIITPTRLNNTGFWGFETSHELAFANWNQPELMANFKSSIFKNGRSQPNYGYRGATGLYSTSEDLLKWIQSLRKGDVLKPSSKNDMFYPHATIRGDLTNGIFYGYGWFIKYVDGELKEIRHGGAEDGALGHNGIIRFNDDYLIIVLSNSGLYHGKGKLNEVEWSTVLSIAVLDMIKNK